LPFLLLSLNFVFALPFPSSAAEQNEINPEYEENLSEPAEALAQAGDFFSSPD